MDISGRWQCVLDTKNKAFATIDWTSPEVKTVNLPGSTDIWQFGHADTPNITTRLSRKHRFEGAVWLKRDITLSKKNKSELFRITLERTHWKAEAWLDGIALGSADSLSAPNCFWCPSDTEEGVHTLVLRIDNTPQVDIGGWAHAITDETQTNWNGVIGKIEVSRISSCYVTSVSGCLLRPETEYTITVCGQNRSGRPLTAELGVDGWAIEASTIKVNIPEGEWQYDVLVKTSRRFKPWDEFSPNSCKITITISAKCVKYECHWMVLNCLYETDQHKIRLNGRALMLRGTVDCAIWPLTGYPPMDKRSWLDYLNELRRYGVNHVRFHSWCPPRAAFLAADELGMILQVELPLWVSTGHVGDDPKRVDFLYRESRRILETYGQHPSFAMLSMGNELGDGKEAFLDELIAACRKICPHKLYTRQSGFGLDGRSDDYMVNAALPAGAIRGGISRSTADDFHEAIEDCSKPVISHEIGQYSMYADFSEIPTYTGVLAPYNLSAFKECAKRHGVYQQSSDFLNASSKFATLLYKDEYEKALRTSNLAGFQSLGLQDFPGQGSAMVGLFNALMKSKQVVTPARHREFFNSTVPLIRMPKRVYRSNEHLKATIELSHYGPSDIVSELKWHCGERSGHFSPACYETGCLHEVGEIDIKLPNYMTARCLELTVEDSLGRFRNSWSIWVVPRILYVMPVSGDTSVTNDVHEAVAMTKAGGRVLLYLPDDQINCEVPGSFFPVSWNARLFAQQAGTLGLLIKRKHPALRMFPTMEHSDWQWQDIIDRSRPMDISGLPAKLEPIVQVIDDFGRNIRLACLVEAKLGKGRIIISSMDIRNDLTIRPAAALLMQSILDYMTSNRFAPEVKITQEQLFALTNEGRPTRYLQPKELANAILWVKTGITAPDNRSILWHPQYDQASISSANTSYLWRNTSLWHDSTGSSWHGSDIALQINVAEGTEGVVWLHLHDWNNQQRQCRIFIEGRDCGSYSRQTGSGLWVSLPFTKADTADKKIEIWFKIETGPNVQVTQFAVVPSR